MTYPRLLLVGVLTSLVAAGCGGASTKTRTPPVELEPASGTSLTDPPPKLDAAAPSGSANGQRCTSSSQCESGYCIDGVCCDTNCSGTCKACDIAGSLGRCTEVPDNEDPDNECATDMPTTCRRDGMCD